MTDRQRRGVNTFLTGLYSWSKSTAILLRYYCCFFLYLKSSGAKPESATMWGKREREKWNLFISFCKCKINTTIWGLKEGRVGKNIRESQKERYKLFCTLFSSPARPPDPGVKNRADSAWTPGKGFSLIKTNEHIWIPKPVHQKERKVPWWRNQRQGLPPYAECHSLSLSHSPFLLFFDFSIRSFLSLSLSLIRQSWETRSLETEKEREREMFDLWSLHVHESVLSILKIVH